MREREKYEAEQVSERDERKIHADDAAAVSIMCKREWEKKCNKRDIQELCWVILILENFACSSFIITTLLASTRREEL